MVDGKETYAKSDIENAEADRAGHSSSTGEDSRESTETEANGGTRSSPPRVGGTGSGEAKSVKAVDASRAKETVTDDDGK